MGGAPHLGALQKLHQLHLMQRIVHASPRARLGEHSPTQVDPLKPRRQRSELHADEPGAAARVQHRAQGRRLLLLLLLLHPLANDVAHRRRHQRRRPVVQAREGGVEAPRVLVEERGDVRRRRAVERAAHAAQRALGLRQLRGASGRSDQRSPVRVGGVLGARAAGAARRRQPLEDAALQEVRVREREARRLGGVGLQRGRLEQLDRRLDGVERSGEVGALEERIGACLPLGRVARLFRGGGEGGGCGRAARAPHHGDSGHGGRHET